MYTRGRPHRLEQCFAPWKYPKWLQPTETMDHRILSKSLAHHRSNEDIPRRRNCGDWPTSHNLFSRRVGRNCNRLVGQRSIGDTPKRKATTWLSHSKTSAFGSLLDFMSLTKRDLRIASHNTPGTIYVDDASQ